LTRFGTYKIVLPPQTKPIGGGKKRRRGMALPSSVPQTNKHLPSSPFAELEFLKSLWGLGTEEE
jgi:hypothetical protein